MSIELDEFVRRQQARADAMRKEPLPILLGSEPGPYRLPPCTSASIVALSPTESELILDTAAGQRILIPIAAEVAADLADCIALLLRLPKD